jgi:hypothetical protein
LKPALVVYFLSVFLLIVLLPKLLFCSAKLTTFSFLCVAGKMKDLGALVNAASKKIASKKKQKNVQSLEHLIAGSAPGSSSGPVVDLEGDEPSEELVQDSAKKQRVRVPSEDPLTPIKVVPVRFKRGDFLQLPEPELCSPSRPFSWMTLS